MPGMLGTKDIMTLRKRWPWRSAVLALLVPVFLCFTVSNSFAKETQVSVDVHYAPFYGWDNIQLGVAKIQYKGKAPYLAYALTGRGLNDLLNAGEEPQAHLKRCLANDNPMSMDMLAKVPRRD